MSRFRVMGFAILAVATAAFAAAQNAGDKTAGPTRNDYRLRIVQPAEGARVVGSTLEVIVDTEIPAERDEPRRDVNSMPRPDVLVFLDDSRQGRMRDENNVVSLQGLTPGPHTLVFMAMNRSGEVIDRKQVNILAVEAPKPVVHRRVPPPAPVPPAVEAPAPKFEPEPVGVTEMPKTGTSNGVLALVGLALMGVGATIRRVS
jgi:LPXTG-motif cell wall-anchored protein